jgi:hypothetical protein
MADWKKGGPPQGKVKLNNSLELQILFACPWSCHACDQMSNFHGISFIKKGTMSMKQIEHFITEMKLANAYFGRIRIVGGEPTVHPAFVRICELLYNELVLTEHIGHLELVTNGDQSILNYAEKIEAVKPFILHIHTSGEGSKQKHHTATYVHTPESLGYEGKRCGQPEHCGWSLSYYGYAPCSSGAGIMRLRDLMPKFQKNDLPMVAGTEANWPELQSLCNVCYHALRDEDKIKCGTGMKPGQHALNTPSPEVWTHLAPWLNGKEPDWPIYGQPQPEAQPTAA